VVLILAGLTLYPLFRKGRRPRAAPVRGTPAPRV